LNTAGLGVRDVVGVFRDAQSTASARARLVVFGLLAEELAKSLRSGSTTAGTVQVGSDPTGASALVVILPGVAGPAEEHALRKAARENTPVLVVQTDRTGGESSPYVLATNVVECPPGQGFPVAEIARGLARVLGRDGIRLAAQLPVLRDPVAADLIRTASWRAAAIGVAPWSKRAHFPAMTLDQWQLVLDLAAVHGKPIGTDSTPELGAVTGTGLGVRGLVRRLPRLPLIGGVTGYLATRAIGEAAIRRHAAGVTE
jgi:uncharacterized protein (DUF697 family)